MSPEERQVAERVVRFLCLGGEVSGIRFGAVLQLLIRAGFSSPARSRIHRDTYINLGSRWTLYPSSPDAFPNEEEDLPVLTQDDQLAMLCSIREQTITDIRLGDVCPHLTISLESGSVLFLIGRHEQYESWQMGIPGAEPFPWLVVAAPGCETAVWSPDWFHALYETSLEQEIMSQTELEIVTHALVQRVADSGQAKWAHTLDRVIPGRPDVVQFVNMRRVFRQFGGSGVADELGIRTALNNLLDYLDVQVRAYYRQHP